jgi:hypothetical protein
MGHEDNDIYKILIDQSRMLGEIQADLKNVVGQVSKNTKLISEHDTFITEWKGRVAVLGVFMGAVGTLATEWIKNKLG